MAAAASLVRKSLCLPRPRRSWVLNTATGVNTCGVVGGNTCRDVSSLQRLAVPSRKKNYCTPVDNMRREPASQYTYHVAASYVAKDKAYRPTTNIFLFDPYHRSRQLTASQAQRPASGHDAFFASRFGRRGGIALGVADGVGGWIESGVDPAHFSHGLCEHMARAAFEQADSAAQPESSVKRPMSARQLLREGYKRLLYDGQVVAGGSTACVATASPDGVLDVANLGDSGFVQIRLGAVQHASIPQTHEFNTPYQLSIAPPQVRARAAAFGATQLGDDPSDADVSKHQLMHGDVLVFATDGVWDNLFNQNLLAIVNGIMLSSGAWLGRQSSSNNPAGDGTDNASQTGISVPDSPIGEPPPAGDMSRSASVPLQGRLATAITAAAKAASTNATRDGPFAKAVQKYYPRENWRGGKVDDICVVAVVVDNPTGAAFKAKL